MSLSEKDIIPSAEALTDYYAQAHLGGEELRVGIELERSGVYRDSLDAVQYNGNNGYLAVYKKLRDEVGWEVTESKGDNIHELLRGEARLTLEADGRPELSGSPNKNLHDLAREFRLHDNELREIGNVFNIAWVSMGMEPFHNNEELPLLKKDRYDIFFGIDDGLAMQTLMRRLNGLTVNLTYLDEENLLAKAQHCMRVLPFVGAMFACSPFNEGALADKLDMRRAMLKSMDRCPYGVPENFLDEDFTLRDWINYYLDLPVILMKDENGNDFHPEELCFREWMEHGYQDRKPTPYDFDQHVKTLWADLRLRPGYLEYRVTDSVPAKLAMSLPALMKGLVFDSENWNAVREMTENWTLNDIKKYDEASWNDGLQTDVNGKSMLMYAQELITLANEKLHAFERTDAAEEDESLYLAPLKEQIYIKELSPAEELKQLFEGDWDGSLKHIVTWCEEEYSS